MDSEAARVDIHAHRVVDERERHERQQHRQGKQHEADGGNGFAQRLYLLSRIYDVRNAGQAFQGGHVAAEAILIGVVGFKIDFKLCRNGACADKVAHVALQRLVEFLCAFFFWNIIHVAGIRRLAQRCLQFVLRGVGGRVVYEHRHRKLLAELPAEVVGHRYERYHRAEQNEHQRRADAGGYGVEASRAAFLSALHK